MRFKADADGVRWKLVSKNLISLLQKKLIIPAPFKRWAVIAQFINMRKLSVLFISIFLFNSAQGQEKLTQRFQSMVERDWITDAPTFTKTSPSFFNEKNFEEFYLGELEVSGFNKPFAWDSDLSMLRFISTTLDSATILTGAKADPNYLGTQIKWKVDLTTLLWFDNVIYQSTINYWYLIGRSDCGGIRKFPNVMFEQVFEVDNPRLNVETGLFIVPFDSSFTSISKSKFTLKTTEGNSISGDGFDLDNDGINDAFIYYETVDPSSDLPSTYKRLLINVGGEWRVKWQHLDEECL